MVNHAQKTGHTRKTGQARKAGLETPFTIRPKRAAHRHARTCDWQGCVDEGEFRTHKSPREMGSHVWYCADHIREHNKSWNYFEGLTDDEVEAVIKNDTVWQRPTWELGSKADKAKAKAFAAGARIQDNFGFFNDATDPGQSRPFNRAFPPDSPVAKAYAVLDLDPSATIDDVKTRYKKLVKRHHPDANGGCKEAEETFKEIGIAYQTVLKYLNA
ncbi:J domain-containing protein [Magnetovibrio sp.]|uniref:J domain-containing protein n=1 Tax=Magnetovibrio sp. TaxID=2024836 RepID=UPI002F92ECBC